MILLDTHIWILSPQLTKQQQAWLSTHEATGLGVSIISCWEVAKLIERGKLNLALPVLDWLNQALQYPGVRLIELTPEIVVESTQLPVDFHRDPADQMIVATARIHDCELLTVDTNILAYPYVKKLH